MKIIETINTTIIETALGGVQSQINKITGWDVDDCVSDRTLDYGTKLQMINLGAQSDPINNENTVFPTLYIGTN